VGAKKGGVNGEENRNQGEKEKGTRYPLHRIHIGILKKMGEYGCISIPQKNSRRRLARGFSVMWKEN